MRRLPPPLALAAVLLAVAGCREHAVDVPPAHGPVPPAGAGVGPLTTYRNPEYRYSVAYPAELLPRVWPPLGRHDGRGFLARNAECTLRAFSRRLRQGRGLAVEHDRVLATFDSVTYEATLDSAFVVSGYRGSRIAYTKVARHGRALLTLELEYPAARRALYDRVVEAVAPSFPAPRRDRPTTLFAPGP